MECNLKVPLQPLLLWAGSGCHYWFETTGSNCCHMTHVIVLRWTFSIFHCALVDNDQKHVCFCGLNFGFNILDIIATFPASKQQRISVDVFCENWMQHFSMLQSTSLSSIVFLFKFCNVDWCETKWAIKLQKKTHLCMLFPSTTSIYFFFRIYDLHVLYIYISFFWYFSDFLWPSASKAPCRFSFHMQRNALQHVKCRGKPMENTTAYWTVYCKLWVPWGNLLFFKFMCEHVLTHLFVMFPNVVSFFLAGHLLKLTPETLFFDICCTFAMAKVPVEQFHGEVQHGSHVAQNLVLSFLLFTAVTNMFFWHSTKVLDSISRFAFLKGPFFDLCWVDMTALENWECTGWGWNVGTKIIKGQSGTVTRT
jgi:hypothetical protein